MKKILAIVLALVMTMSMATISSGAAFTDAESIQYADAVNTLNALGVVGGYANGSFGPKGDVTRGAAAKMVAMVATASNPTAIGYYAGTSSFADVPATHTFADAVAFCVARGIVAGYGNGTYGVGDNVKGWAVAKMVLVAMGYDAAAYGMEGTGSALNTITLASQVGLFDGMAADFVATDAASREECAQIVYNALTTEGVKKSAVTTNGITTYEASGTCLLNAYADVADVDHDDMLAGVTAMDVLRYGNVYMVTENQATGADYTVIGGVNYAVETGLDMIGHMVAVVAPSTFPSYDANGVEYYNAYNVVDLSSVVDVEWAIYADKAQFQAAFGKTAIDTASYVEEVEGEDVVVDAVVDFVNYSEGEVELTYDNAGFSAAAGTYVLYNDGYETEIVSYLTSSFEVGYVSSYKAGTAAKDGAIVIGNVAAKENSDASAGNWNLYTTAASAEAGKETNITLYDGIAQYDVVIVEKTGDLYTVSKAATVTGTVDGLVDDDANYNWTLSLDGTTYYLTAQDGAFEADVSVLGLTDGGYDWTSAAVTKKVVLYLDANGGVVAIAAAAEETVDAGIVYVVDTYDVDLGKNAYGQSLGSAYYVQAVDMNGKEVSYQVALACGDLSEHCDCDLGEEEECEADHTEDCDCTDAEKLADLTSALQGKLMKVTTKYDAALKATVAEFTEEVLKADIVNDFATVDAEESDTTIAATALKVPGTSDYFASDVKFIYVATGDTLADLKVTVKDGVQAVTSGSIDYYAVQVGTSANYNVKYVVVATAPSTSVASTDVVYVANAASTTTSTYVDEYGVTQSVPVYNVYINGELKSIKSAAVVSEGFAQYTIDSVTGLYTLSELDVSGTTKKIDSAVVTGLYDTLLTAGALDDADASKAQIVDLYYAANSATNSSLTKITTLAELLAVEEGDTGATIAVVYEQDATGAQTVTTIYVLAPVHAHDYDEGTCTVCGAADLT